MTSYQFLCCDETVQEFNFFAKFIHGICTWLAVNNKSGMYKVVCYK